MGSGLALDTTMFSVIGYYWVYVLSFHILILAIVTRSNTIGATVSEGEYIARNSCDTLMRPLLRAQMVHKKPTLYN